MSVIFWAAFFAIFYTYLGFPLTLFALSLFKKEDTYPKTDYHPAVSMIIPVHNEEKIIEEKIKNSLSLDYPEDKLQIIVASDGSSDRTNRILAEYKGKDARLAMLLFEKEEGKLATIIKSVEHANAEILVFTDADTFLEKDALENIVKPLADETVGAVSANVRYPVSNTALGGRDFYWGIENFIRSSESKLNALSFATGPFWAMRRKLFPKNAPLYAVDDALLAMEVMRRGYRVILDKNTKAKILPQPSAIADFIGTKRAVNGGFQALIYHSQLLNFFKYPMISFCLVWHKIMRWLTFLFLAVIFFSNIALLCNDFYKYIFALQVIFYMFAIIGLALPKARKIVIFRTPFYLVCNWVAIFFGFFEVILNKKVITWHSSRIY